MTLSIVFLGSAEDDLMASKRYVASTFGAATWQASYGEIKRAVASIRTSRDRGSNPDELTNVGLTQYRQIIAGMNRIVYQVRGDTVYVHIVCDTRKDLKSLLMRWLMIAP